MKTPIEIITQLGLSITSHFRAVEKLSITNYSIDEYNKIIEDILGLEEPLNIDNIKFARIYACYVVQETIKEFQHDGIPDMVRVAQDSINMANKLTTKHPYYINQYEDDEVSEVQTDGSVKVVPKKKKGAKKERAERIFNQMKDNHTRLEIINQFIEQLDMTKSGATTYFHNCKQKFGFKKKEEEKQTKKRSKMEIARELYSAAEDKSKAVIMTLFQSELNTSKLGSQTYYYACKKEYENQK